MRNSNFRIRLMCAAAMLIALPIASQAQSTSAATACPGGKKECKKTDQAHRSAVAVNTAPGDKGAVRVNTPSGDHSKKGGGAVVVNKAPDGQTGAGVHTTPGKKKNATHPFAHECVGSDCPKVKVNTPSVPVNSADSAKK